jgi:hypothetical protein
MGTSALFANGLTHQFLFLIRDARLTPTSHPYHQVRKSRIVIWLCFELVGFAATFAITNTIASIGEHMSMNVPPSISISCADGSTCTIVFNAGFPIVIASLIPFRILVVPRLGWFTDVELDIVDGPVASEFTMESVDYDKVR